LYAKRERKRDRGRDMHRQTEGEFTDVEKEYLARSM
jgi:hypothetical protein